MGTEPETPREVCHCITKMPKRGFDPSTGWGKTLCRSCGKHIKWGVQWP